MSSLHHPVAILAADTMQQVSIGIIFLIAVCLMLVPFAALGVFVIVEVRSYRRDRHARANASPARPPLGQRASQVAPRGEAT